MILGNDELRSGEIIYGRVGVVRRRIDTTDAALGVSGVAIALNR